MGSTEESTAHRGEYRSERRVQRMAESIGRRDEYGAWTIINIEHAGQGIAHRG